MHLRSLDLVDVSNIVQRRASVMRSPLKFLCGAFRSAMRVALQEIVRGAERRDERVKCRGWKLFLSLPRMLLFRTTTVSQLTLRVIGSCCCVSEGCDGAASQGFQRRRRNHVDTPERRADRAQSSIMMVEVSGGRQAWEGAGTRHTLDQLQDPVRPTTPYAPFDALQHHRAEMAFALDNNLFVKNLRCGEARQLECPA